MGATNCGVWFWLLPIPSKYHKSSGKLGIVYGKYVHFLHTNGIQLVYHTYYKQQESTWRFYCQHIFIYNYIYSSTTTQTLLIFDAFAKQLVFRRMKKSEAFPGSRKANSALIAFHKKWFFGGLLMEKSAFLSLLNPQTQRAKSSGDDPPKRLPKRAAP